MKTPRERAHEINKEIENECCVFSGPISELTINKVAKAITAAEAPLLARIKEAEQSVERLCETTTNQQTRIIELLQKQDNLEHLLEAKDARIKELEFEYEEPLNKRIAELEGLLRVAIEALESSVRLSCGCGANNLAREALGRIKEKVGS